VGYNHSVALSVLTTADYGHGALLTVLTLRLSVATGHTYSVCRPGAVKNASAASVSTPEWDRTLHTSDKSEICLQFASYYREHDQVSTVCEFVGDSVKVLARQAAQAVHRTRATSIQLSIFRNGHCFTLYSS
jgi:hypothetical protein